MSRKKKHHREKQPRPKENNPSKREIGALENPSIKNRLSTRRMLIGALLLGGGGFVGWSATRDSNNPPEKTTSPSAQVEASSHGLNISLENLQYSGVPDPTDKEIHDNLLRIIRSLLSANPKPNQAYSMGEIFQVVIQGSPMVRERATQNNGMLTQVDVAKILNHYLIGSGYCFLPLPNGIQIINVSRPSAYHLSSPADCPIPLDREIWRVQRTIPFAAAEHIQGTNVFVTDNRSPSEFAMTFLQFNNMLRQYAEQSHIQPILVPSKPEEMMDIQVIHEGIHIAIEERFGVNSTQDTQRYETDRFTTRRGSHRSSTPPLYIDVNEACAHSVGNSVNSISASSLANSTLLALSNSSSPGNHYWLYRELFWKECVSQGFIEEIPQTPEMDPLVFIQLGFRHGWEFARRVNKELAIGIWENITQQTSQINPSRRNNASLVRGSR